MTPIEILLRKKTLLALIREFIKKEEIFLNDSLKDGENKKIVWNRFKNNIALLQAKAATILRDP